MSKLVHKQGSSAEERANRMENLARKVANKERCKHGMIFEYCGTCQRVEYQDETKFPVQRKDADGNPMFKNGKPVYNWYRTEVTKVRYMRYR